MSTDGKPIDVTALIDNDKVGRYQIRILLLCAAVICVDGFDLQAIGYIAPTLGKAWNLAPGSLGPVFSASLLGLMIGALTCGPLADRVGRKWVIVVCTAFFGVCSLATVLADSPSSLAVIRFVTGLGLGGVMPNAIALTGEYSPRRSRATMIMMMFCGQSLGSVLGGVVAAKLVPLWGWTSVFWVGGILPIVLALALIPALPESIHLLVIKGDQDNRVRGLLARINPAVVFPENARFIAPAEETAGFPVRELFTDGRALVTVLMWVIFFMNLLVIYLLANWLPTVINGVGLSVEAAVYISTLYHVGAIVGALTLGSVIDKFGSFRVLAAAFVLAGLFVITIGSAGSAIALLVPAVFAAGYFVVGAQGGANATAATYYPTAIRSTGVGWALGIGRIGSIIGPVLGGMMIAQHWSTFELFVAGAIPEFVAAAAAAAAAVLVAVLSARGQARVGKPNESVL
jgi:AAHS family 4-hydroxybenzoate transporter-like MFS transporter